MKQHEKLRSFGYSNIFQSSFRHGNKREVSILIHDSVKFDYSYNQSDKEGRYVILKGTLENVKVTLVNVYNLPNSNKQFLSSLINKIIIETEGMLI